DEPRLRCRISRRVRIAFLAGDGCNIDDAPVVLCNHRRSYGATAVKRAVEIDGQNVLPGLERIVPGFRVWPRDAGIVDQDIDMAERLDAFIAPTLDIGIVGHVDCERRNATALLQFGHGLPGQIDVTIPDRNHRTGFEETLDNGAPDALRATRDNR